jgi:beta-phosphoglucomutase-like phosphatase (HAD superfamily)
MKEQIGSHIKALIFDLDGTLADSLPVHVATWNEVGRRLGFKFDTNMIIEMTGRPTIDFARKIALDFNLKEDPFDIVEMKQEAFRKAVVNLKPVPEVFSIALEYHGKLPMAIGTGASRRSATAQLGTLGIAHLFDAIVTANDVTRYKPEPETFLKCAGLMGVDPADCHVFEDGVLGIEAAKRAGMSVTDVRPFINYGNWI